MAMELKAVGFNPNNGLSSFYQVLDSLDTDTQKTIRNSLENIFQERPPLAMVNSDKGITCLHVPSDVIIDASMPAMIRTSGQMWGPDANPKGTQRRSYPIEIMPVSIKPRLIFARNMVPLTSPQWEALPMWA